MEEQPAAIPAGYSYPATAGWFGAGAAVTAVFSGSLAMLARNAELAEVLMVGMVVPSFTWVVQMTASGIALPSALRRLYWGDLGRVCLLSSTALLPCGDRQSVSAASPALAVGGKRPDQRGAHGCGTVSAVGPPGDRAWLANQLVLDHYGEHGLVRRGELGMVVTGSKKGVRSLKLSWQGNRVHYYWPEQPSASSGSIMYAIPKLIYQHADELALMREAGVPFESAPTLVQWIGWAEILVGLAVFLGLPSVRWPFILTIAFGIVTTVGVAISEVAPLPHRGVQSGEPECVIDRDVRR